ncbi:integrase core domain-containing protein [Streptomyces syringium]|uniref:integrase core domain-containing protein n=1 Tax=Streptomyces syringium TaxID=76729 RepID=UPI0033C5F61C
MSAEYTGVLRALGLRQSAGRTAICYDNSMAESFFRTIKNERAFRATYLNREVARQYATHYIEFWHNRQRLHSSIGYRPPNEAPTERQRVRIARVK